MDKSLIEWGSAELAMPGQGVSGDRCLVKEFPNGAFVAVVDGLGHGEEAATPAEIAIATLKGKARESAIQLVRYCHEALIRTRGVVMTLASFNGKDNTMTWLGIGNIEGILLRANASANPVRESVLLRGGVVGYQLPTLRASVLPVMRGDTLIFATDGINSGFNQEINLCDPPQQIANHILMHFAKGTDDALVLVVRYVGGP